jgi:hypothetical protein
MDYLGIVEAAKNFCEEFGERQKVEIDFQSHDLPTGLPTELSLTLFRVLQEALRNAAKHSGVKRFDLTSTRRFSARPEAVSFDAAWLVSPYAPGAVICRIFIPPCCTRMPTIASIRGPWKTGIIGRKKAGVIRHQPVAIFHPWIFS